MAISIRSLWTLLRQTASAWSEDDAPSMGAALAYYSLFSIAPLLVIVIAVTGLVFGEEVARRDVFAELADLMGPDNAVAVQGLLEQAARPSEGLLAAAVGFGVLLVGATTVFAELQNSLDRIWRAPPADTSRGLWIFLRWCRPASTCAGRSAAVRRSIGPARNRLARLLRSSC